MFLAEELLFIFKFNDAWDFLENNAKRFLEDGGVLAPSLILGFF